MPSEVRLRPLMAALLALLCASLALASSVARNPLLRLGVVQNSTIQTPTYRVTALSHFDLTFDAFGRRVRLRLEPNHDVIAPGAKIQYAGADGTVEREEEIDRLAHKVFKGKAWLQDEHDRWRDAGWARIVVRRDGVDPLFEGAFSVGRGNSHHVQMSSSYVGTRHELDPVLDWSEADDEYMVVWRDSDVASSDFHTQLKREALNGDGRLSCQSDRLDFNSRLDHPLYADMRVKRSDSMWSTPVRDLFGRRDLGGDVPSGNGNSAGVQLVSTIGQTAGCPTTHRVALVGVATDCTYTKTFNSTESTRANIITQINTASTLYEKTFNISLGLQNLFINNASCPGTTQQATPWNVPCSDSVDLRARLNLFSGWRGQQRDNNSHWTLLTACNTGSAVGLAWLGMACVNNAQYLGNGTADAETVTGANVVAKTPSEWQVIAHETGHTFGAVHDCTDQTCNDGKTVAAQQCCPLSGSTCDAGQRFIMNPTTADGITDFSACSVGNICAAFLRNSVSTQCFSDNRGVTTITGQQCGNGIVEEGEECDCGGAEGCAGNACCDPTTCKFTSGSVCDDSNEDCCRGCQFAGNGTVCRASTGVCDPEEVCSGSGATCPKDVNRPNGDDCGGGGLTCASGQCTSRDRQCKTVMGSLTSDNDTYACDSRTCTLSCASPEFGANTCYSMSQNFLDGTPCGGGGQCQNGQCAGTNVGKEIKSWIDDHEGLVIGLSAAVGAVVLFMLAGCAWRCVRRRRAGKAYAKSAGGATWIGPGGGGQAPLPPDRRSSRGVFGGQQQMQQQQMQQQQMQQYQQWQQPQHSYYGGGAGYNHDGGGSSGDSVMSGANGGGGAARASLGGGGGGGGWDGPAPPPMPPAYAPAPPQLPPRSWMGGGGGGAGGASVRYA